MTQENLAFLMSPSAGILDNWLPVMDGIRRRKPAAKISVIIPHQRFVDNLDAASALVRLGDGCVDQVIWREIAGAWVRARDFSDAIGQRETIKARPTWWKELRKLRGKLGLLPKAGPADFIPGGSALLYDVYEEAKDYNREILAECAFGKAYSICHGIDIHDGGLPPADRPGFAPTPSALRPLAFTFSKLETDYYSQTYVLPPESVAPVGVPRHDSGWVERIRDAEAEGLARLPDRFIGLVSRPANDLYLPADRKLRALEALKAVSEETGLPIVLKRHPKEVRTSSQYEEVFGADNLGRTWFETNVHWLAMGPRCVFALCFYSGVALDLSRMGVPVAEWLDLRGLPHYDNPAGLRLDDGTPVLSLRFLGLVSGVDGLAGLREFAVDALTDRSRAAAETTARYREIFENPDGAIGRVLDRMGVSG